MLLDNSVLSSLAKIGKLGILKNLGKIAILNSVLDEAFRSGIETIEIGIEKALDDWLIVQRIVADSISIYKYRKTHPQLSRVDCELILTAKKLGCALITDDQELACFAEQERITVFDLESILLALKEKNILTRENISSILAELEVRDSYKFSAQKKKLLLESDNK